jgi:hypothetical protein
MSNLEFDGTKFVPDYPVTPEVTAPVPEGRVPWEVRPCEYVATSAVTDLESTAQIDLAGNSLVAGDRALFPVAGSGAYVGIYRWDGARWIAVPTDFAEGTSITILRSAGGVEYRRTGAATLAFVNVESLVRTAALDMGGYAVTNFANESGAIVDLHSPGGATVLLSSTFAAEKALGYLTASHKYFAVMSARIFLWKTANPDTVVGWIDLPPIGMRISTDASNVATVAFNRSASDIAYSWDCYNGLMGDALPLAAAGLLPLLAASTGGFTISLTEAAGLACTAKCVGRWINRLELLV